MPKSGMEKYKEYVAAQLGKISPLLQSYAIGDFSKSIKIPEKEDEFTELLVGISLMADDIKELINTEADRTTRLSTGVNKMIDAVQKMARGDHSVQIELSDKNDELDSLAMGINMMMDDVRNEITERKETEEKLQESEEQYRSLFEGVPIGLYRSTLRIAGSGRPRWSAKARCGDLMYKCAGKMARLSGSRRVPKQFGIARGEFCIMKEP